MSDSKEKQGTGQEIPDGDLDPEVVEPNMTINTETQDQFNENQNISAVPETEEKSNSNPDAAIKSETVNESNVKPDVSVETETVDKHNTSQNISAETEIGTTIEDKNNSNRNVSVETEVEDKSCPNQVISAAIENGDTINGTQEEAPNEVKNENENDLSPPKLGQEDEKTEVVEVPQNLETKTREDEVLETQTHKDPSVSVAPVLSVKVQAENGGDDDEDRRINENENDNNGNLGLKNSFLLDDYDMYEGGESGTEDDQSNFMKELESFFKERSMEFKPPKFYGEGLNCLKLWRAVTRLGGYDKVTSCKLWRQVGESFKPPKTCTTVSWTFRGFYEKALLDYERHKINGGELALNVSSPVEPMSVDAQALGSGRARRDAAARAMQGWHSQRLLGNGEVGDPIIKDKNPVPGQKREKQLKSIGLLKRKKPSYTDDLVKALRPKTSKSQLDTAVVDVGPPADWVKINVQRTKDCFEIYALVPGLLREEVRVQSDPAGRLVISGEPEQLDNPWGVTPFKKVVSLPSRIDPQQTSAVVTLHGQLFVRVPFEHSD